MDYSTLFLTCPMCRTLNPPEEVNENPGRAAVLYAVCCGQTLTRVVDLRPESEGTHRDSIIDSQQGKLH